MSVEIVERLADAVGGTLRYNYSGRCMYGKRCVGIVTGYLDELVERAQEEGLDGYSTDNMGLDYIMYWPNITEDQTEPDYVKTEQEENVTEREESVEEPSEPAANVTEREDSETPEIKLTEKQHLIMDALKKNEIGPFVTKDLVDFVDMNARSITGVVSSLKKKGLLVKSVNGSWTLTELGKSV